MLQEAGFDPDALHQPAKPIVAEKAAVLVQVEVIGFLCAFLKERYAIAQTDEEELAQAVNAFWTENYSDLFRENCCENGTHLTDFVYHQINASGINEKGRISCIFRHLGFRDFDHFVTDKIHMLERILSEKGIPLMVDEMVREVHAKIADDIDG